MMGMEEDLLRLAADGPPLYTMLFSNETSALYKIL